MLKKVLVLFVSLVVLAFTNTVHAQEFISVPGTGDGVAILNAIGEAFTAETGIKVLIPDSIGSSGAIEVVGEGKALIGRVAREIKDDEKHLGLTFTPFAKVPTVFIVNSSVGVEGLTHQQVVDIYSGRITNWAQVGGNDREIIVIRREDGDSSLKNLRGSFPGFADLAITETARTAIKTQQMVHFIKNVEDSIGFGPLDVAKSNDLNVIKIDGKGPFDKDYPSYNILALIYKQQNLKENIKKFVDFALSESVRSVIINVGGIPL